MNAKDVDFKTLGSLAAAHAGDGPSYIEFLRVASMSAGTYVLPAGSVDTQSPHGQDELYYVVSGKARLRAGAEERSLDPGTVVFVAAQVAHRFYDIQEKLTLLVFFAPPEG